MQTLSSLTLSLALSLSSSLSPPLSLSFPLPPPPPLRPFVGAHLIFAVCVADAHVVKVEEESRSVDEDQCVVVGQHAVLEPQAGTLFKQFHTSAGMELGGRGVSATIFNQISRFFFGGGGGGSPNNRRQVRCEGNICRTSCLLDSRGHRPAKPSPSQQVYKQCAPGQKRFTTNCHLLLLFCLVAVFFFFSFVLDLALGVVAFHLQSCQVEPNG